MVNAIRRIIGWKPHPGPQEALITCPVFEVFFGGARGGGKTEGFFGDWLTHAGTYGQYASGLVVRRTLVELTDTIERSKSLYGKFGGTYHAQEKMWRFANGARLRFAYLENDSDADNYQGHEYTRVYVEELGNFPDPAPVFKLFATLRSSRGVPVGFRANGNPGGVGHAWIKQRYIDPAPLGMKVIKSEFKNPFTKQMISRDRVFIPSRLGDNPSLGDDYVANLAMQASPALVKAWLEGDWSIIEGAFFPEFSMRRHVIAPIELPEHWLRFRAMDWGSAKPFSVGWYAVSDGELTEFPRGALIRYREWYGCSDKQYNVGLKLTTEQVAQGIVERSGNEKYAYSVIDPAAFAQNGGPSIAERMADCKARFSPADNTRVGGRGAITGWDLVRSRLVGDEDEKPMLYLFSTCTHLIRTLPSLPHDKHRAEDVDTDSEDHAGDELRYACASRPYIRKKPKPPEEMRDIRKMTANEAFFGKAKQGYERI